MKVAISGFGRIGRDVARIILEQDREGLELVVINDTGNKETSRFSTDMLVVIVCPWTNSVLLWLPFNFISWSVSFSFGHGLTL